MKLKISDIVVEWSDNSRGALRKENVDDLAESLQKHGLINPVTVKELPDGRYQLSAGYTRLAAAKKLGWDEIDVFINNEDQKTINFVENIKRSNLSMYQEALALKAWRDQDNVGYREIAKKLNVSINWISARLRLLELDEETQRLADGPKGTITAKEIHERFEQMNPSDKNFNMPVQRAAPKKKDPRPRLNREMQDVVRQLVDNNELGTPVVIALNWASGLSSNAELEEALGITVNENN